MVKYDIPLNEVQIAFKGTKSRYLLSWKAKTFLASIEFQKKWPSFVIEDYLGIKTVSCRLLQRMETMDMDWNVKKLGQLFHVLMQCLRNSLKILLVITKG